MHNKLFIADGVMAVAGGRNIGDEYFLRSESANFIDMDAFVMGAVVQSMAQIFDRYWNSEVVYPIEAVGEPLGDKVARANAFDATMAALPPSPPVDLPANDLLGYGPLVEELDSGQLGLEWGIARAFADPPEKLLAMTPKIAFEMSVTNDVMMQVWQAKERSRPDLAVHDPRRDRHAVVPQPRARQGQGHGDHELARGHRRAARPHRLFALSTRGC